MSRTPTVPSVPGNASPSARNGPSLPRARNMTCDETPCSRSVPATLAARSSAAVSRTTNCGPMCSAASGEASSTASSGSAQWPSSPAAGAEHLPQRRQVGRVDDVDGLGVHQFQAFGRRADRDALALGQREHAAVVVGVDDPRAAVTHLPAVPQRLGKDLDALDVMARIEDLRGMDDRVGHGGQVGHAATLGRGDAEHGEQQARRSCCACRAARSRCRRRSTSIDANMRPM